MFFPQQRKSRSHVKLLTGTAVVLLFVGIVVLATPKRSSEEVLSFGTPFLHVRAAANEGARFVAGLFASKGTLIVENERLREENTMLRAKAELFDEAEDAYDELYALASGITLAETRIARVLASPGVSPYDIFLIDIGASEGVAVGDVVTTEGDIALGRVDAVGTHTSRVVLFSSPLSEESVIVPSVSLSTTAYGEGGGSFVLRVPKDIVVAPGDVVRRVGDHDILAQVVESVTHDTDAFQTVRAGIPVNIYELMYVFVATPRED